MSLGDVSVNRKYKNLVEKSILYVKNSYYILYNLYIFCTSFTHQNPDRWRTISKGFMISPLKSVDTNTTFLHESIFFLCGLTCPDVPRKLTPKADALKTRMVWNKEKLEKLNNECLMHCFVLLNSPITMVDMRQRSYFNSNTDINNSSVNKHKSACNCTGFVIFGYKNRKKLVPRKLF